MDDAMKNKLQMELEEARRAPLPDENNQDD
jgi:hypothetical protein